VEASSELHARYQLGKDTPAAGAAYLSAPIKLAEVSNDDVRSSRLDFGPPFQATSS
jgi:hypothetical protein